MRLFLSAGEPSGDLHGANLIESLRRSRPDIEFEGLGGPAMRDAGCHLHYELTKHAVMGIWAGLKLVPRMLRLLGRIESHFRASPPDALVVIDYPGFHFRLIERAKRYGIPVVWFVPPQVWAWNTGRVERMRKYVDHILCTLPFEKDWYAERGVEAHDVGHPFFEEVSSKRLDADFVAADRGEVVGVLPGSRAAEVQRNAPMIAAAASVIRRQRPDTTFLVGAYNGDQAAVTRGAFTEAGVPAEIHAGRTSEVIEASTVCVAASGSVSLELMARRKPTVVVYRVTRSGLWFARRVMKCRHISLVNLIAGRDLFPEFLTARDESPAIAERLLGWLVNPDARSELVGELGRMADRVAKPGACQRAAAFILERLGDVSARHLLAG